MRDFGFTLMMIIVTVFISSCGIYSFTGASIHPDAKTVSVEFFKNDAPIFNPTLSQEFTEMLQDKLSSQTTLDLVEGKGHLHFKGRITDYNVTPMALKVGETAAQNRLTITVKVEFANEMQDTYDFNQSFTRYFDYPSEQILSDAEPEIVPQILELLTDDIFQKAVVNW